MARSPAKVQLDPVTAPLVLVVEDERDCRELYVESLAHSGLRVASAANAADALRKIHALRPDIVTTDIGLQPGMDGCQLCETIKGDARTNAIPVIAVTAWAMKTELERAKLAGCDSVLTKPCLPKELLAEVRRLLKLRDKRKQAATKPSAK